jgi:two-component system, NarL family, nitrate/nitrite response regulator NarL
VISELNTSRRPTTVVIADDESMFRASLRHLLSVPPSVIRQVYGVDVGPGFEVVGEAECGEDTLAVVATTKPDLLLLDLVMPRRSGLEALRELQEQQQVPRILVLAGAIEKPQLLTAVQLGVRGAVLKNSTTEILFEAIMCVVSGQNWLGKTLVGDLMEMVGSMARQPGGTAPKDPFGFTRRQREVLALVAAGYGNKDIARQCAVSEETIKHHLTRMFGKVGASNRVELTMLASQSGLIENP